MKLKDLKLHLYNAKQDQDALTVLAISERLDDMQNQL